MEDATSLTPPIPGLSDTLRSKRCIGTFLDAQGQLTLISVVQSGRNSILCISLLSVSLKRIGSIATEKKWRH